MSFTRALLVWRIYSRRRPLNDVLQPLVWDLLCRWVTEPQLEVVVPAKRTPWPPPAPPPPFVNETLAANMRRAVEELALAEKKRQGKQSRKGKSKKKPSKEES